MKNNRIVALFLSVALMVGVVAAKDVPSERDALSNDTIKAASAELVRAIYPVFDKVRTLQKKIVEGTTIREEEFLQLMSSGFAKAPTPVLSMLSNETHWIIGLNLLRTVLDELRIAKKLSPSAISMHDETPIWLSEAFLKKTQQRFAEDIGSGKMQFIGAIDVLGGDLFRGWLNLLDMQDSVDVNPQNFLVLVENFGIVLERAISWTTIKMDDAPGERSMGVSVDLRGGIEMIRLVIHWHEATSKMKFTKGEIDLFCTFLTKFLPEEMPKMLAASPMAQMKPGSQEEVKLCVDCLFSLYKKAGSQFLEVHFPV